MSSICSVRFKFLFQKMEIMKIKQSILKENICQNKMEVYNTTKRNIYILVVLYID